MKRSLFGVMCGLSELMKTLRLYLVVAIFLGTLGHLAATFITVLGGYGILKAIGAKFDISYTFIFLMILLFAASRGILRYLEQTCNHYIAFKLLVMIRHKIFAALRKLAPAKLEGREKGNLISIITSDIEQLEVFYAHTISPVAIAVLFSIIVCIFMGFLYPSAAIIAAIAFFVIGVFIPISNYRKGEDIGNVYRSKYGELNTQVLDNLYGMEEILQYGQEEKRSKQMEASSEALNEINVKLKQNEGTQKALMDATILLAGFLLVVVGSHGVVFGTIDAPTLVICLITLMSSFGPVAALSALSNHLTQTFASANRVLDLLQEEPECEDVIGEKDGMARSIVIDNISFAYENTNILEKCNFQVKEGEIFGIHGESGSGKSTLLKLMMRFFEVGEGNLRYGTLNVNQINTKILRKNIAYMTQETFLFHDTIENNIKIANQTALREDVIKAAKKASIHDFIISLPKGYDTRLSELGISVSSGEKQRIGLARAFLHQADILLLDEPTSNVDSLNEGIILRSIQEERKGKTIVLVSHRESTMKIADTIYDCK